MLTPGRRAVLAGGAAALVASPASRAKAAAPPAVPVARVEAAHDTYFGEVLSDPYRWMEDDKDPEWLPFMKGQNAHARAVLDAIPGRDALLERIGRLSGGTALTRKVQRAGERMFYEQRPSGADNFKLMVREAGADRVLVDPTAMHDGAGHVSLDWWSASPDGSHLAYGLSKDGSEDSVLHVLATADGRDLPDRIANTQNAQPNWLDDGRASSTTS